MTDDFQLDDYFARIRFRGEAQQLLVIAVDIKRHGFRDHIKRAGAAGDDSLQQQGFRALHAFKAFFDKAFGKLRHCRRLHHL